MSFSRRTLSLVTVLLVLGLLGGGVWWRLRSEGEGQDGAAAETAADSGDAPAVSAAQTFSTDVAQPVTGAEVVRDTLWISVTAAGQAAAHRRTVLTAQVEGPVQVVPVRENSTVRPGQTLVQIDTTQYALAVDRARGDLLDAEAKFQEMILFDDEIEDSEVRAQRERLARSRSGLAQAQVALREAQIDLDRTTVTAPFGGRVADLKVVPGQFVRQGDELMTIVEIDPVKVEVQVLEAEVGYLEEGRRGSVTFAAFPGETFRGRIETINPVVEAESRTARVTLILPNPDGRIKPGMYAKVSLDARSFPNRILVPRAAILERDRRAMLFLYEEEGGKGRAKWNYVTTGLENDSLVEIVPNPDTYVPEPGEIVLVDGHHYLVHDAVVRLVENVAAAGGRPGR